MRRRGATFSLLAPRSQNRKRFTVRRIIGAGDLWVTEFILTYDDQPSYTVSIMEFIDGKGWRMRPKYFQRAICAGTFAHTVGGANALRHRSVKYSNSRLRFSCKDRLPASYQPVAKVL